jgi:hypothetical protein
VKASHLRPRAMRPIGRSSSLPHRHVGLGCPRARDQQDAYHRIDIAAVVTGEEGEDVLHTVKAKLYVMEGDAWKERGLGNLKILTRVPENGGRVTRLGAFFNLSSSHK